MRYSIKIIDAGMAVIVAAAVFIIFKEQGSEKAVLAVWSTPWIEAGFAVLLTSIVGIWAVFGSKLDRRCAEDYVFQILSNAALIAVITAIMSHAIWDFSWLNERGLPKPTSGDMLGVTMLSWGMAYGFYRIRGVNP